MSLAGLLIVAVSALATAAAAATTPSRSRPFERALVLYAQGKLHDAELDLQQTLAANPSDRRACTLLGVIQRETGRKPALVCDQLTAALQTLTADQLFQAVAARNPEIGKSIMQVVQARAELRMAKLAISPEFSILGRIYPSGVLLSLTQSLFGGIFQRQASIHQREAGVLAAIANYAKVRDDVLDRAAAHYFTLRAAQERIPLLENELGAAGEVCRVALVRTQYGAMSHQQQLEYDRQLAEVLGRLSEAKGQVVVAASGLNALMDRPVDAPLTLTPQDIALTLPADYRQVLEASKQHRPEIEQALRNVEVAKAGRQVALRDLPRIDLRATWGSSSKDGRGEFLTGPSAGVRATVPLFIIPMQRARSRRELAIIDQLEFELGRIVAQAQLESVSAWDELTKAQADLHHASQQVAAAEELVRVEEVTQVHAEGGDLIRFGQARMRQAEVAGARITSKYAVQQAAYRLQRMVGIAPDQPLFDNEASAAKSSETAMPKLRAMWVWKPEFLDNQDERQYLLDFAVARQIGTIFLSASANSLSERGEAYRLLIAAAHSRNIRVEALQGEAEWALKENYARADRFLQAVVQFSQKAPAGARFDAIHLDVEPHTLPAWKAGQQERIGDEFVELLTMSARVAHGAGLGLVVDLNPSLERVKVQGTPLVDLILAQVDGMAVMAYRDSADSVVEASTAILRRGATPGKPIWIGLSADRAHLRPAGEGSDSQLDAIAAAVEKTFQADKSFCGVAIHDYRRYRGLLLGRDVDELSASPKDSATK